MIKLLIVDDEPLVLLSLKKMIKWENYGMCIQAEAKNGKEAFAYICEHPEIDIVITDVDMPLMSGLELCEALSEIKATQSIVFLSSFIDYKYVRNAFKLGGNDYILKSQLEAEVILPAIQRIVKDREESKKLNNSVDANCVKYLTKLINGEIVNIDSTEFSNMFPSLNLPFYALMIKKDFSNINNETMLTKIVDDNSQGLDYFSIDKHTYILFAKDMDQVDIILNELNNKFDIQYSVSQLITSLEQMVTEFIKFDISSSQVSRIVNQAKEFIQLNFTDMMLQVSDIAQKVGVSNNYLSNIFSKEVNQTILEYINITRIDYAKKLLVETSLKSYEIASNSGFSTPETFNRNFKKITGLTPLEYKNSFK